MNVDGPAQPRPRHREKGHGSSISPPTMCSRHTAARRGHRGYEPGDIDPREKPATVYGTQTAW